MRSQEWGLIAKLLILRLFWDYLEEVSIWNEVSRLFGMRSHYKTIWLILRPFGISSYSKTIWKRLHSETVWTRSDSHSETILRSLSEVIWNEAIKVYVGMVSLIPRPHPPWNKASVVWCGVCVCVYVHNAEVLKCMSEGRHHQSTLNSDSPSFLRSTMLSLAASSARACTDAIRDDALLF